MKTLFLEFEVKDTTTKIHFEVDDVNLEFVFGLSQHYTKELSEGYQTNLRQNFIPSTVFNHGLLTVDVFVYLAIYKDNELRSTGLDYWETLAPGEYQSHNITYDSDHFDPDKISGQLQIMLETCHSDGSIDLEKKSKEK